MHRRKLWLLAGVVLAALALAATGSARVNGPATSQAKSAGTLVFGAEQGGGPDWCINQILDVDCNAFWNVFFQTPVIRGAFLFTPTFKYKPDLISRYTLKLNPQRVTYYIRGNAHWSDGVQVTGKDFRFTFSTVRDPKLRDHISQTGYENIKSVSGNGKVVTVVFKRNYAAWRNLFNYVLPAHALAGANQLTVWESDKGIINPKNGQPIGDGPFLLSKFDRGCCITLTRNPKGWYGPKAKLDSIVFKFITNTNSEIQAIRSGEVDAIYPQPQLALADLKNQSGLKVVTHLSLSWEHIEIQQGPKGNPLAKNKYVRQALITSLNRGAAAKALYGTLKPDLKVLNSLVRLSNEPGYQPKMSKWNFSTAKVDSLLKAHQCSKGGDGIYRCGGTKLSFLFESTVGNALRTLAFTIFQDQAGKAGIELRNGFVPAGTLFGSHLPEHNFDLAMFTSLVPVDPAYNTSTFACGLPSNYTEYCNRTVTNLLRKADRTLNEKARLTLVNKAGTILADEVPMIPLFQRPTYLVYKTNVKGMVDNPTFQSPSYAAEKWNK